MRIVIKNADFSSVSIGKVVEDLSRSYACPLYDAENGRWYSVPSDFFANATPNGSTVALSAYYPYIVSNGSIIQRGTTTSGRVVTNFVKVIPGMTIISGSASGFVGGSDIAQIVCFDENRNLVPSSYYYSTSSGLNYTVPNGVAYVKIQLQSIALTQSSSVNLQFNMPT